LAEKYLRKSFGEDKMGFSSVFRGADAKQSPSRSTHSHGLAAQRKPEGPASSLCCHMWRRPHSYTQQIRRGRDE
jgi:hypothetical protein